MSLKLYNENYYNTSDDEDSFPSSSASRSIVFSSGRSSSPTWSRSSSMTSGISAISTSSSESKRKLKACFGPISRPAQTELRTSSPSDSSSTVQQQSSTESSPNPVKMKYKRKSFTPVQPKIYRPITNMAQPQGWVTAYSGLVYGPPPPPPPPPPLYPHPMMYYQPPPVQMPMDYSYSVPMLPPVPHPPMYSQLQLRCISVQQTCTTWTYIAY